MKRITLFFISLALACLLGVCKPPQDQLAPDNPNLEPANCEILLTPYPGYEIIFYDTFGLFCTNIYSPELKTAIGSFDITLSYNSELIEFESIYSAQAFVDVIQTPGSLRLQATDCAIGPGEYPEFCSITWQAVKTGFVTFNLQVNALATVDSVPLSPPPEYMDLIKVVREKGEIAFDGPGYFPEETEFTKRILLDTHGAVITGYDIDIIYTLEKIAPLEGTGESGIEVGAAGFLNTVLAGEGRINLTGTRATGIGPGEDLDFLSTSWSVLDSGRAVISIVINKMVTTEDEYIKPSVRGCSLSLYAINNIPVTDVWLDPEELTVAVNDAFMTKILLNPEGYVLAAYGIDILYDPAVLELDISQANGNGLEAGSDGFLTVFNVIKKDGEESGEIMIAGFDLTGRPANPQLELLNVYWKAIAPAESTEIMLDVKNLSDIRSRDIIKIKPSHSTVIVTD